MISQWSIRRQATSCRSGAGRPVSNAQNRLRRNLAPSRRFSATIVRMVEPFYGEPRACITLNCRTAILNKGWRIHSSFIQAAAVWRISVAERIVSDRAKPALEQTLADLVSELLYVRFIGKLGPAPSLSVAAKPKQVRTDTSKHRQLRTRSH